MSLERAVVWGLYGCCGAPPRVGLEGWVASLRSRAQSEWVALWRPRRLPSAPHGRSIPTTEYSMKGDGGRGTVEEALKSTTTRYTQHWQRGSTKYKTEC